MIRFIWVSYIPQKGWLNRRVIAAIAAGLEMFRRFQWNFCEYSPESLSLYRIVMSHPVRLENEQIGNTDQYRATREVPLPYAGRYQMEDDDDDESDIVGEAQLSQNGKKPALLKLSRINRSQPQMHQSPLQSPVTASQSDGEASGTHNEL